MLAEIGACIFKHKTISEMLCDEVWLVVDLLVHGKGVSWAMCQLFNVIPNSQTYENPIENTNTV